MNNYFYIGNNIKKLYNSLGISQGDIVFKLGVTQGYISRVVNDKAKASLSFVIAFCATFNIDKNWLLTGKGEMFLKDIPVPQACSAPPICQDICEICKGLPPEQRKELLNYAEYIKHKAETDFKTEVVTAKQRRKGRD